MAWVILLRLRVLVLQTGVEDAYSEKVRRDLCYLCTSWLAGHILVPKAWLWVQRRDTFAALRQAAGLAALPRECYFCRRHEPVVRMSWLRDTRPKKLGKLDSLRRRDPADARYDGIII